MGEELSCNINGNMEKTTILMEFEYSRECGGWNRRVYEEGEMVLLCHLPQGLESAFAVVVAWFLPLI